MPPKTYDSSTTLLKPVGGRSSQITIAPIAGPTAPKTAVVTAIVRKVLIADGRSTGSNAAGPHLDEVRALLLER